MNRRSPGRSPRRRSPRHRSPRRRSPRRRSPRRSLTKLRKCVSNKIGILRHEGYPQKQAIAIAYSMCQKEQLRKN